MDRIGIIIGTGGCFTTNPEISDIRVAGKELRCLYPRLGHETLHIVLNKLFDGRKVSDELDDLLYYAGCTEEHVRDFYPLFYPWEFIWLKNPRV